MVSIGILPYLPVPESQTIVPQRISISSTMGAVSLIIFYTSSEN